MRRQGLVGLPLLCVALMAWQPAHADDHPMLDYLTVSVGLFANSTTASLRADGNVKNSGTRLDFSHDLGQGGTRALPYIDVTWRPWDRHEFEFSYYHDSNDSSRTLSRTLEFNDRTLLVGAQLSSRFTLNAANVSYRYWAWIGDQSAFGVWGGLQFYRFSLQLSGNAVAASSGSMVSNSGTVSRSVSSALPDPTIGLSYRYQMVDWARLVADGGAFKINVNNLNATLYSARLGVEFYPWHNVGIITQYMFNKINADVTRSSFHGSADFRFNGFQALVKVRF